LEREESFYEDRRGEEEGKQGIAGWSVHLAQAIRLHALERKLGDARISSPTNTRQPTRERRIAAGHQ
jgi:hypothetical protein